ncbi:MAG: adenylate/guanylate cyclase domain-containing protein, partial [Candidatus Acidiferrales bacterium]
HWGTLDKYQGDAVMAFWGAPYEQDDHAVRACSAALDMSRRVDELRAQWRAAGKPDINIGVGASTGQVVVGNMGSRKRFNYTVLGDAVNLASRLEGVNKEYATRILVSESTYQQAGDMLQLLEQRLCQHYKVTPEELQAADGREPAREARRAAVYLVRRLKLASLKELAERYAIAGDGAERAAAELEQQRTRSKPLDKFLTHASRSLRPLLFRQLDWIRVKGKQEPVAIYELMGEGGEADGGAARLLELYNTGLQAYRGQQWEVAASIFEEILRETPNDGPAGLMLDRCRHFRAEPPPADWDGVYEMKTK